MENKPVPPGSLLTSETRRPSYKYRVNLRSSVVSIAIQYYILNSVSTFSRVTFVGKKDPRGINGSVSRGISPSSGATSYRLLSTSVRGNETGTGGEGPWTPQPVFVSSPT